MQIVVVVILLLETNFPIFSAILLHILHFSDSLWILSLFRRRPLKSLFLFVVWLVPTASLGQRERGVIKYSEISLYIVMPSLQQGKCRKASFITKLRCCC